MLIDFSPVDRHEVQMLEFAKQFSLADLKAATNASIDFMLDIIKDMSDAQLTFLPYDPDADDPHAVEGEEKIGWSLAHLVVHVTASAEEGAAFSSMLARGIPYPERTASALRNQLAHGDDQSPGCAAVGREPPYSSGVSGHVAGRTASGCVS